MAASSPLRHQAAALQQGGQSRDRVVLAQIGHLVLGSIHLRVALEVAEVAVGLDFDQAGAFAAARAPDRRRHRLVHLDRVVVRHLDAGHAVGRGAVGHPVDGRGAGLGHRDRPLVVLADEDHRQLPQGRQVQRLMKGALVGRAFAEEGHRHPVLAQLLGREGRAAGRRQAGADDAAAAELVHRIEQVHVAALALAQAGDLAEHLGRHRVERHALGNGEVVRPVRADHGVLLLEVRADAHRHRLLAGGQVHLARHRPGADVKRQALLDVGRQLALQIDIGHGLLVVPDLHHLLVHPEQSVFVRLHPDLLRELGLMDRCRESRNLWTPEISE